MRFGSTIRGKLVRNLLSFIVNVLVHVGLRLVLRFYINVGRKAKKEAQHKITRECINSNIIRVLATYTGYMAYAQYAPSFHRIYSVSLANRYMPQWRREYVKGYGHWPMGIYIHQRVLRIFSSLRRRFCVLADFMDTGNSLLRVIAKVSYGQLENCKANNCLINF